MNVEMIDALEELVVSAIRFGEGLESKAERRGLSYGEMDKRERSYAETHALRFADEHGLSDRKVWER